MTMPNPRILTAQSLISGALSGWFKLNVVTERWRKRSPALCRPAERFLLSLTGIF